MPSGEGSDFSLDFRAFSRSVTPFSKLRLAPTPSGFLHIGNAVNFILNWLAARQCPGARLLLRIDDLDADRKRPEFVQDIFDTLNWLELDWDEGPQDAQDFEDNWSQYRRMSMYEGLLAHLRAQEILFPCRKSRKDLTPFGGAYPVEFRDQGLSLDGPDVAWRIRTPQGFAMQDLVVRRRDGIPAYQIANVADDVHFGITHIIRGADLLASTEAQMFLAEMLHIPEFLQIRFLFHPLLLDEAGQKLSKSAGAAALVTHRQAGESPDFIFKQVASLLQLPAPVSSADSLLQIFRSVIRAL